MFAINHLKAEHRLEGTMNQVCLAFSKQTVIPKIEEYVSGMVQKKGILDSMAIPMDFNANVGAAMANRMNLPPNTVMNRGGHQRIVMTPNNIQRVASNMSCSPRPIPNAVIRTSSHVRVEGGRIVNLPRPNPAVQQHINRMKQQQHNNQSSTIDLSRRTQSTKASTVHIPSLNTMSDPGPEKARIKCLHCNLDFANRKVLRAHHRNKHSSLPFALGSLTPTQPKSLLSQSLAN
jgi:hypothetical protein